MCPSCEKQITEAIDHLSCIHCGLNYCRECIKIKKEQFELIKTPALNLSWTCPTCRYTLPTLQRLDKTMTDIKRNNEERLTKLELEMADINIRFENKVEEITTSKINEIKQEITQSITINLNTNIDDRLKENESRRQRSLNLMVYNLEESNDEDPQERKSSDHLKLTELAQTLGIELEIQNSFRIGNKQSDKIRPLKLVLASKKTRGNLLRHSKNIKLKAPAKLKNVIITCDFTPLQRMERKELLKQLEETRKIHKNAKIRDGQIIIPVEERTQPKKRQTENEKKKPQLREKTDHEYLGLNNKIPLNQTESIRQRDSSPLPQTDDLNSSITSLENFMDTTLMDPDTTVRGGISLTKDQPPLDRTVNTD